MGSTTGAGAFAEALGTAETLATGPVDGEEELFGSHEEKASKRHVAQRA